MRDQNTARRWVIQGMILTIALIYLAKLFHLQVVDDSYKSLAANNVVREVDVYPTRGLIYDRAGRLIVFNEPIYDIEITPRLVRKMDTAHICSLLKIEKRDFVKKLKKARKYSTYKPSIFLKQVNLEEFASFSEHIHEFPGFMGNTRTIRSYPYPNAALVLGDVGETDSADIASDQYKAGDYIGKGGIEKQYESVLRGSKGTKSIFVDVHNRVQGSFKDGAVDIPAVPGTDLTSTLDIELQQYGEQLMHRKIGSIVAIEPSTGEILAFVSSPAYDPNLLCGRARGDNFKKLAKDTLSPLFNRPVMAQYPPGSTFKPLVAAIALEEQAIKPNFAFGCSGIYTIPGYVLKCSHGHPAAKNVMAAIQHSCNPYFWRTFENTLNNSRYSDIHDSYGKWVDACLSVGMGDTLGIDLPGEKIGNLPDNAYYDKLYGKRGWRSQTIISLGIGQGEILMTPLQLANLYAVFANRGYYFTPHLIKSEENRVRKESAFSAENLEHIVEGLALVVDQGTGRRSKIPGISLCGKTGTAQNPHGEDHSIFAAFAPKDDPKIAIAVVVENAGGGSRYAAPITSLIAEKYLNDTIMASRKAFEQQILEADLISPKKENL